jgi:hypothetical protein
MQSSKKLHLSLSNELQPFLRFKVAPTLHSQFLVRVYDALSLLLGPEHLAR